MKKGLQSCRYLLLIAILGCLVLLVSKIEKVPNIQGFLRKISGILNTPITSLIILFILAVITFMGIICVKAQDKQKDKNS